MRVLIDSHTLIWYVDQPQNLSTLALATMVDPTNDLFLGAGVLWEISIKVGMGKLTLSGPFRTWITQAIQGLNLGILPLTIEYADSQAGLPMHHRDPFDRLLVAQALVEQMPISTIDAAFDLYGVSRIW